MNIGVATNKSIVDLYNMMQEKSLILKPFFQRNLVWNHLHKENFIDTILRGLPFPEIYLSTGDVNLKTKKATLLVVDGQQRLRTIYDYINDTPELVLKNIKRFSSLSKNDQTEFLEYSVVVRELGRLEDEKIKEIFRRINSIQYALNAMEINNALYQGEYISVAKDIIDSGNLSAFDIFSETQYARMRDIEFILSVMTTIEAEGYFSGVKEIESYVKEYDDNYPSKNNIKKDITNTLRYLQSIKLESDSIWFGKSSLFSLIVELISFKRRHKSFPEARLFKDTFTQLGEDILEHKGEDPEKDRFAKFYKYMYQATATRRGRIARAEVIQKYLKKCT